jgi:restriction system protein
MSEAWPTSTAFERLLAELQREIESVRVAGERSFALGNFTEAAANAQRGQRLAELRDRLAAMRDDWASLHAQGRPPRRAPAARANRRDLGRAPRGERTRERDFFGPILEALLEMGGRGRAADVLDRVLEKMKPHLRPIDFEILPSAPEARWRKTAQWARHTMVQEGLLRDDSPRGIWEVTDQGRAWLDRATSGSHN